MNIDGAVFLRENTKKFNFGKCRDVELNAGCSRLGKGTAYGGHSGAQLLIVVYELLSQKSFDRIFFLF